jgi:hypothetical protein
MADFKGGFTFKVGDGADPEVFTALDGMRGAPQTGVDNTLIDTTDFDSTMRDYMGGLVDGQELTIDCKKDLTPGTAQATLVGLVDNVSKANFETVWTDGTTTVTYSFRALAKSYVNQPSYDDVNMITFTLKVVD